MEIPIANTYERSELGDVRCQLGGVFIILERITPCAISAVIFDCLHAAVFSYQKDEVRQRAVLVRRSGFEEGHKSRSVTPTDWPLT